MGAVSSITEFSNSVNVTDVLAAGIAPAFQKATCMMSLMYTEGLPADTMTKKFAKRGNLTAASLAEANALAPDANGELSDTSVSATIAKCAVVTGISVEQGQFGNISADRIASEHGSAIARFVDNDALGLFSGFSTSVTSASILTIDDVMLGQFNIFNSECPQKEIPLKAVLSHRGHYNIKKEIVQSGASVWSNESWLEVLGGTPQANCYVGSLLGSIDFYATSGHAASGGDTVQAIFHPVWALAGVFAPAPVTWVKEKGSEGFFTEYATYFFYDVLEYNDLAGVKLLSDT
jgi:hypothetical protein